MFRIIFKKFITAIFLIFCTIQAIGQWQPTSGPISNLTISELLSKDTLLLASASCGTFYATTENPTWHLFNYNVNTNSVIFKDTIYLANTNCRKLYSNNGVLTESVMYDNGSNAIYDLYADLTTIYSANEWSGFKLSQNGTNWTTINSGLPFDVVYMPFYPYSFNTYDAYAVDGNNDYIFVGAKDGIYKSSKANINWVNSNNGLANQKVNAIYCRDSIVIIAMNNNIYKSNNNGNSWALTHAYAMSTTTTNKIKNINDTLYILSRNEGIYFSVNFGDTWMACNNNLANLSIGGLTNYNGTLYLGNATGVFKNKCNWMNVSNNLVCGSVLDIVKNDSCIAAVNFANVSISKDNGDTWSTSTTTFTSGVFYSVINVNNSFFFSAQSSNPSISGRGNFISSDNGNSWNYLSNLPNYGDPYLLSNNGNKIIAYTDNHIYLSVDSGLTWSDISPSSQLIPCGAINSAIFNGNDIYLVDCGNARLYKSIDLGTTWQLTNNGLPNAEIYLLGKSEGILFAATELNLYKSTDEGLTWQYCSSGLPNYDGYLWTTITDFATDENHNIFMCTVNKVYASSDFGNSWINISAGLPYLPGTWGGSLLVKDSTLFFGTNKLGIWKRNIPAIQLNVNKINLSETIKVYPIPAKDELNIKLPENENAVEAEIIDLFGKVISNEKLINNKINIKQIKPGMYILKVSLTNKKIHFTKILKSE